MNYPLISEYIEAIKSAEDNFDELSYLRPVLDDDGLPVMTSGNFAVVFKMKDAQSGKFYAVKCFTKEQEGRSESYKLIADELEFVSSNFLTSIKFYEKELFVDSGQTRETEFPVLLMNWVDGEPLDKYIHDNANNQYALEILSYRFGKLSAWLLAQPFAHGDLKPDNILVKEDGSIVLVDYDGMYVPAMKGQKARELGSPNFRHPSRTEEAFDERIDDFSIALIALSLKAFSLNPELIEKYCFNDYMFFKAEDSANLFSDNAINSIHNMLYDDDLKRLFGIFLITYAKNNIELISPKLLILENPKSGLAYGESVYNQARSFCDDTKDKSQINYDKAFQLFIKAANMGNADAQCCVGCCYKHGYGTKLDYIDAWTWYNKSAKNGCARAYRHIAMNYEDGVGVNRDIQKAIEWYQKAIEKGDYTSAEIIGKINYYGRGGVTINYDEAVKWYTIAAEHGNSDGMCRLADCYENGQGVERDFSKAFDWYRKAAEKDNPKGLFGLGVYYELGCGVEKNYSKAYSLYNDAAEKGHIPAFWGLGNCYEKGLGVEKDIKIAVSWYKKAAENGSIEGQWCLGQCYRYGRGVPQDINAARYWYKKAAEQGHKRAKDAYENLSKKPMDIYVDGCNHINNKEYKEAYEFFRTIALSPYGQNGRGVCYAYGYIVEKDMEKAAYWFLKAARKGLDIAQFNIGNCYYNGLGILKDWRLAFYWYDLACEQGLDIANEMHYDVTYNPLFKEEDDKRNFERRKEISNLFILYPLKYSGVFKRKEI